MNNAIINIRTKPEIKKMAQAKAEKLGLNLSSVMNGLLQDFVATKDFHVSLEPEQPSEWLIQQLKESAEDEKAGRVHSFATPEESIAFLRSLRNKK